MGSRRASVILHLGAMMILIAGQAQLTTSKTQSVKILLIAEIWLTSWGLENLLLFAGGYLSDGWLGMGFLKYQQYWLMEEKFPQETNWHVYNLWDKTSYQVVLVQDFFHQQYALL